VNSMNGLSDTVLPTLLYELVGNSDAAVQEQMSQVVVLMQAKLKLLMRIVYLSSHMYVVTQLSWLCYFRCWTW
jgi:hypothetical protein